MSPLLLPLLVAGLVLVLVGVISVIALVVLWRPQDEDSQQQADR